MYANLHGKEGNRKSGYQQIINKHEKGEIQLKGGV